MEDAHLRDKFMSKIEKFASYFAGGNYEKPALGLWAL
jgi:hypothetical protein